MPDQFTHYLVAREAARKLDVQLDGKAFALGAQGADLLYYTEAFGSKLGTRIGFVIHRVHTGSVPAFFGQFAEKLSEPSRKIVLSYAAGIITHFWSDVIFHPYITYRTGVFILGRPETVVARYRHKRMESAMDFIFAKHLNLIPPIEKFNPAIWITRYRTLPKVLREAWRQVARHYDFRDVDVGRVAEIGYIGMRLYGALFYPPTRWRYVAAHILKLLIPFVPWFTYLPVTRPATDFTNENHDVWFHPCLPDRPRRESIFDMFDEAVDLSASSIRRFLKDPTGFRLPDLSLETGLEGECEYKVFDIIEI